MADTIIVCGLGLVC